MSKAMSERTERRIELTKKVLTMQDLSFDEWKEFFNLLPLEMIDLYDFDDCVFDGLRKYEDEDEDNEVGYSLYDGRYSSAFYKVDGKQYEYHAVQHWLKEQFEEMESYGGEDLGTTWYIVIKHKKSERFMKYQSEYYSYHGHEFNGEWQEVKPKVVERIVYEFED